MVAHVGELKCVQNVWRLPTKYLGGGLYVDDGLHLQHMAAVGIAVG